MPPFENKGKLIGGLIEERREREARSERRVQLALEKEKTQVKESMPGKEKLVDGIFEIFEDLKRRRELDADENAEGVLEPGIIDEDMLDEARNKMLSLIKE